MKVYCEIDFPSRGISRVVKALHDYRPERVRFYDYARADLIVLHVRGRRDHLARQIEQIQAAGKQYAMIQYVLRSCRNPNTADWLPLWREAECVWSYYDLHAKIAEDGAPRQYFAFYHAPLGAEPTVFQPLPQMQEFTVCTIGNDPKAESLNEVWSAAARAGKLAAHVSDEPMKETFEHVRYFSRLSDGELAALYNRCAMVSALRRKDGFEIPAVEALLCGVRPLMYNRPDFTRWFGGLAEFVPETEVADHLTEIFRKTPQRLTQAEIAEAQRRFDWKNITAKFWDWCA